MNKKINIILDTDPGMGTTGIGSQDPEDGFAIMLALNSPELNVKAITVVHGNVPLVNGYSNALHLVNLLGKPEIPVAPGFDKPLKKVPTIKEFPPGENKGKQIAPLADINKATVNAVDLITNTILNTNEPITIVAIGPLTNIAMAILSEPALSEKTEQIIVMGGALKIPGNITPSAEYNIWSDPYAASVVFNSKIPFTLVGLDVCHQTLIRKGQITSLNGNSPLSLFIKSSTMPWFDVVLSQNKEGFHLYDSLAVAVSFLPELVKMEPVWIEVETESPLTAGETVAFFNPLREIWIGDKINCKACTELLDKERFAKLIDERVLVCLRD